ncbi:MAG: NUDIX domain-containing protein [Arenicellales bacterium]|nr:NUDIX domain-containing protein [Arenicellales bacterium]
MVQKVSLLQGVSITAAADNASRPVKPQDAGSLIMLRWQGGQLQVLMGQRRLNARFMPGMLVFPGGAVDASDRALRLACALGPASVEAMAAYGSVAQAQAQALALAAVREAWEETGLLLGVPGQLHDASHPSWQAFAQAGKAPALGALRYVGRAITPVASRIRFHARFFMVDASHLTGNLSGDGELCDLEWWQVGELVDVPMLDVTRFMLERAVALLQGTATEQPAPLFTWRSGPRIVWR